MQKGGGLVNFMLWECLVADTGNLGRWGGEEGGVMINLLLREGGRGGVGCYKLL
jgi:hypothetical protein